MEEFQSETFERAPLIEVALSVQFQPIQQFTSAHAGEFWQLIKAEFSISQEQMPLPPIGEFFGQFRGGPNFAPFGLPMVGAGVRNWFSTPDGSYLLQLQRDRLALNWRKTTANPDYPRYPSLKKKFVELFNSFEKYLNSNGLGGCEVNIHEATYINQWVLHGDQKIADGLGDWLQLAPKNVAKLEMETASINVQYLVKAGAEMIDNSSPIGRLYVNVAPIFGSIGEKGINLELTCRIVQFDQQSKSPFLPMDLARQNIVTTFKQITSDSAQKIWRGE
jgi:uncharacterized protein (TIGR04255 family)